MTASVLTTALSPESDTFRANAAHNRALVERLRADVAQATLGGKEKSRERHTARGKFLPRDRIERMFDPGLPFLEIGQLVSKGLEGDDVPSAGVIAGIGHVAERECMIVCNDATVRGSTYYPLTVKRHLRAQEIAEANMLPCIYPVDSGGATRRQPVVAGWLTGSTPMYRMCEQMRSRAPLVISGSPPTI